MAVYTEISIADIEPIIAQYQPTECTAGPSTITSKSVVPKPSPSISATSPGIVTPINSVTVTPITAGMENSNYWLSWINQTTKFDGVLTIFEMLTSAEIEQCIGLTQHLSSKGLAVPAPVQDQHGCWLHSIHNKPAIICPRLQGQSIQQVTANHAHQIGSALAQAHQLSQTLPAQLKDNRNLDWWQATAQNLKNSLTSDQQLMLQKTIQHQVKYRQQWQDLPSGWIHGDCFRDNVLFREPPANDMKTPELGAILDWYNASYGPYLYDLAIVYLDWCVDDQGVADSKLTNALLTGYRSVRCFDKKEVQAWSSVCQAASLRFWLSRLTAQQEAFSYGSKLPKNRQPDAYYQRLKAAWEMPTQLPF